MEKLKLRFMIFVVKYIISQMPYKNTGISKEGNQLVDDLKVRLNENI